MRFKRIVMTGLAAALLVFAAACKTTQSTTTTTTPEATTQASTSSTSIGTGTMTSSSADKGTTAATYNNNSSTSSSNLNSSSTTTTSNADNGTTTTLPNGTTVTKSQTTTIVYPNGTVKTLPADNSSMASSSTTDTTNTTNLPPGAVVTKTTTTIKTTTSQPAAVASTAYVPQPIYVTTTPANVYPQPMTSSTTIYQPYRMSTGGRRFPGTNFLIFGDRASFSNSNSALSGTLNSGNLRSDINSETGYGIGINTFLGHSNFSTEFTASRIRPRATFTPSNSSFNPITGLRVRMTPITGALQLHMNPRSSVDFYIGGGAAYVMFRPDNNLVANNLGLSSVKFKDEWGPMVNAGLGFGFSPHFGINFDAKYMWVRANTTTTFNNGVIVGNVGNSERFGLNPFLLSAGLRFGF